jgi:hypothetical protein
MTRAAAEAENSSQERSAHSEAVIVKAVIVREEASTIREERTSRRESSRLRTSALAVEVRMRTTQDCRLSRLRHQKSTRKLTTGIRAVLKRLAVSIDVKSRRCLI